MNKTMLKVSAVVLAALMIVGMMPMMTVETYAKAKTVKLKRTDWNPEVKKNINAMMAKYGKANKSYNAKKPPYAVFDFDNTCSIFDVEEQLAVYQLQTMSFAKTLTPAKLKKVLATQLNKKFMNAPAEASGDYCENADASYSDWIHDIVAAYTKLRKSYKFTPAGLSAAQQKKIQKTDDWKEFATKMRAMYDCVFDSESAAVAYPWVLYWFTGMTETEVYKLAKKSHTKYMKVKTSEQHWESPKGYEGSKIGQVEYDWTSGTAVSKNIVELMKSLDKNGIKVWVCSASATDPIRAAIDVFGLHKYVTGMMAMTNKLSKGKYVNAYDYKTGRAWKPINKSKKKFTYKDWKKYTKYATKAQPQGEGKVICINNVPRKMYKHGPVAGFMDSTGDYNFCTEYKTLRTVICFNRANRKITDGGGVIAALAVHQADNLKLNFAKVEKSKDTLYLLQGRQENGKRGLLKGRETLRLGKTEKALFRDGGGNVELLAYAKEKKLSTKKVINTFVLKRGEGEILSGFKTGFIDSSEKMKTGSGMIKQWRGYHKLK